jgi:transposase
MPSGASYVGIEGGPGINSVGIDLHRKRSHVAALDEAGGELFWRRIVNDPDTFLRCSASSTASPRSRSMRPTAGSGELLEDHGYELHLAHPLKTKTIASA